jgi:hypothetical protein
MNPLQNLLGDFHTQRGGHANNGLAPHACRMLREAVELCIACGASEDAIRESVRVEIDKAKIRNEIRPGHESPEEIYGELGDVGILLNILSNYAQQNLFSCITTKFSVCLTRQWQPDEDGVLWRPGTR